MATRTEITVSGRGLHSGDVARVVLRARPGPVALTKRGHTAEIGRLEISGVHRSTSVRDPSGVVRVGTVEHVLAALAGLGVREGIELEIEGDEIPLLDGGAAAWCAALADLSWRPTPPALAIRRDESLEIDGSRYVFSAADDSGRTGVSVEIAFDDDRLGARAEWNGDADDFRERIAPARTFALTRDLESLVTANLAKHAARESVILITPEEIYTAGAAFFPDEPARHKLLDLIGDLYLHGGPPRGRVHAFRPGHQATHTAMARAKERGLFG